MIPIESLLSARLFQSPQIVGNRIFFVSNMSGRLSLYAMDYGGSVPEPLLPPDIALQNPHHVNELYRVLPGLGKILLMLDKDGDENYLPMFIPIEGGYPTPAFGDKLDGYRCHIASIDEDANVVYMLGESRSESMNTSFRGYLEDGRLDVLMESKWGAFVSGSDETNERVTITEGYTVGDNVLYLLDRGKEPRLLFGTPLEQRNPGDTVPLNSFGESEFTSSGSGLLVFSSIEQDTYGLSYLFFDQPQSVEKVAINGLIHTGAGEFEGLRHLQDDRYSLLYNIDGVSWLYEAEFDEQQRTMTILHVICGQGLLADGVLDSWYYDKHADRFVLSHSTATTPTQIVTVEGPDRTDVRQHTRERVLGLSGDLLSPGEDASFISFDGQRTSARLYLPAEELDHPAPYPLVYYVHGGPQSQERPDFAWFSMPLIQYLTLNGFAVFVPNVRGSTGYGLSYTKQVDRDWGGQDRLDHVHALKVLAEDDRIDTTRAAVIGRSYGGYMTLTLATRHPELWSAAVDMFGPYNLLTFIERLPPTWQPYFKIAVGDPETDREFLLERSPFTHIDELAAPMLVIQGKNDPRVIEQESRDVVEQLRAQGKDVEYLMFPDEGHDVLKYENRVACYTAITDFFRRHLMPDDVA